MKTSIDEVRDNIICIGDWEDMAIFQDELGDMFFKDNAAGMFELGEPTNRNKLHEINILPVELINLIVNSLC